MDFPAAEKCYSHVSQRRASDSSEDSPDDSPSASTSHNDFAPSVVADDKLSLAPPVAPVLTREISAYSVTRQITKVTTSGTVITLAPEFEVDFTENDPSNPRNWPMWYKSLVIFCISYGTLVVVLYSTSYTAAIPAMMEEFGIHDEAITTLGVTTYLFGLAVGSLFLAPISETYGRKPVYAIAMIFFTLLVIPCAVAQSMATIIVVRFFGAIAGSAMIANAPGTVGDIISDKYRATAFSIWSIGPMNGPVFGPVIGGFVTQYASWRWANWVVMMAGGVAAIAMVAIKETYAPALLQKMAAKKRKEEDDERYWSRYDVRVGFMELMKVNLSRPFVMAIKEPICVFWNVYIAIIYGEYRSCIYSGVMTTDECRNSLSLLRSIPNRVPGEAWLECQHIRTVIPWHRYWHHDHNLLGETDPTHDRITQT